MTFLLEKIDLDNGAVSQMLPQLAMRLSREQANSGKWLTLAHPRSDAEPSYVRFVGVATVRAGAGASASGRTQLVVTARRIVGLVSQGDFNRQPVLDEGQGLVACFSVNKGELTKYDSDNSRLRGITAARFGGADDDPFVLEISAVVAKLSNSAHGSKANIKDFLKYLTSEGAAKLT